MDFLIDRNFKVWLIEINTNPCLETSCPVLERLIPPIIENVFKYFIQISLQFNFLKRIALDPLFPPPILPKPSKNTKPYKNKTWNIPQFKTQTYQKTYQTFRNSQNVQALQNNEKSRLARDRKHILNTSLLSARAYWSAAKHMTY